MEHTKTFYTSDRNTWRQWLPENFKTAEGKLIIGYGGIDKYYK